MNKTISYKKLLSIFLTIVFFSPLLIKATHFLFVHHEHYQISFSDKPEINEKHKKCPVCAFEFVEFVDDESQLNNGKPYFPPDYFAVYSQSVLITIPFYSFHLRAPPVIS